VLSISLLAGDEIGGRGKVSDDAGPSTAGSILERRGDGSELYGGDILGRLGRRPLLDDVVLVGRLEDHCCEEGVWVAGEGRGEEEWLGDEDSEGGTWLTLISQSSHHRRLT